MSVPMWIVGVVLASSLSLIITLVRRWRRRLRSEARAEEEAQAEADRAARRAPPPPFETSAPAAAKAPPFGFIPGPGCDAALLAWWRKLDGATTFWLARGAGGRDDEHASDEHAGDDPDASAWWVTWFAPWRRALPERLWSGAKGPQNETGSRELAPGLHAAWRGEWLGQSLLDDVPLWQEAGLCGLDVTLVQLPEGVALRTTPGRIMDLFDLGSLAALAALIEARAGDGVLPQTWDVAAVQLRIDATPPEVWGDLPPFGGLTQKGEQWQFTCRCARSDDGNLRDLWPHSAVLTPLEARKSGVQVRLADGRLGELSALDGRTAQLAKRLGLQPAA